MLSDADLKRISESVNCDLGTLSDYEIKLRRTVRDLLAEIERLRLALQLK